MQKAFFGDFEVKILPCDRGVHLMDQRYGQFQGVVVEFAIMFWISTEKK